MTICNDCKDEFNDSLTEYDGICEYCYAARWWRSMRSTKLVVYIAGPITNGCETIIPKQIKENVNKAIDIGDKLFKQGFFPYIPHLTWFWHEKHPDNDYERWMRYSFTILERCDVLLRIDGESKGADREVEFAKEREIPVFYDIKDLIEYRDNRCCKLGYKRYGPFILTIDEINKIKDKTIGVYYLLAANEHPNFIDCSDDIKMELMNHFEIRRVPCSKFKYLITNKFSDAREIANKEIEFLNPYYNLFIDSKCEKGGVNE